MKRRDFLKNSLSIAGFVGLGASSSLLYGATAQNQAGNLAGTVEDLVLTDETVEDDFTHQNRRVKIIRRGFRRGLKKGRVERWVMTVDGRELRGNYFSQLDGQKGCFYSELLPFSDNCTSRKLAMELVDGEAMELYKLTK